MAARFTGRTALVAGGARGMGAALARLLAAEGASVAIGDVRDETGAELAAEIGSCATYVHLDVTSPADWEAAVAAAGEAGGAPVSVLAQTAGIVHREPIAAMPPERYERLLAVNLLGPFLGIRATIAPMTAVGGGAVVVVSSVDALAGAAGYAGYCASKAGVTGLVKAAAVELAPAGIRVNAIAPGLIDTPMIRRRDGDTGFLDALAEQVPLGRAGDAEDVARAALYLASDDAAYVTGTTLIIDGGVMAQVPLRPPA